MEKVEREEEEVKKATFCFGRDDCKDPCIKRDLDKLGPATFQVRKQNDSVWLLHGKCTFSVACFLDGTCVSQVAEPRRRVAVDLLRDTLRPSSVRAGRCCCGGGSGNQQHLLAFS